MPYVFKENEKKYLTEDKVIRTNKQEELTGFQGYLLSIRDDYSAMTGKWHFIDNKTIGEKSVIFTKEETLTIDFEE